MMQHDSYKSKGSQVYDCLLKGGRKGGYQNYD